MAKKILGIPCEIRSERIRRGIGRVLRAIRRHPRDWARVRRRVLAFRYIEKVPSDETVARWLIDEDEARRIGPHRGRPQTWGRAEGRWNAHGWVEIRRREARVDLSDIVATIAHECGHVATRERDFGKRDSCYTDSEWASEMSADFYAFKWGFEKELRKHNQERRLGHHGGLPGEIIAIDAIPEMDMPEQRLKVDRNFYLRRVRPGGA